MKTLSALIMLLCAAAVAGAQNVQVSPQNRAISITAAETVRVDAEIAEVRVGYQNFGRTQQQTMDENIRAANRITDALLKAGFPKSAIQTEQMYLTRAYVAPDRPADEIRNRQFDARQSWTVRVPAADAQRVVDVALRAGANAVEGVNWTVNDPYALEARAAAAAMGKARIVAERLAKEQQARVGQLLYASNTMDGPQPMMMKAMEARGGDQQSELPPVRLFPQKVERTASILAIFALE